MTTLNPISSDLAALQTQLLGRFEQFRRRVRTHLVLEGVARVLAEAVGLVILSFILDRLFRLGLTSRLIYTILAVGFVAWEAMKHVVRPLRMPLDAVDLASALDREHKERAKTGDDGKPHAPIASRVAAVLQLPDLLHSDRPPSEPMIRRAVHRSYESLQAVDLESHLDARRRQVAMAAIACCLVLPILLAVAMPSSSKLWAKRWLLGSSQAWPQHTYLTVAELKDGRILVPRSEPHVLRVGVQDGSLDPENVSLTLRIGGGRKTTASMNRFGPGDHRFDLPPLQSDATVTLSGGDDDFGPFRIEPVDRPRIADLVLSSQHPTQPAPELHRFAGADAEMAFLPKTKLELTLTSNVPVAEVKLKSNQQTPGPAQLRRLNDRTFAIAWVHDAPVQLNFELVGTVGNLTSVPTPVSIGLKVDQSPRVSLQYTGVRQRITPMAHVPLNVQTRDDYGVVKVDLATHIEPPATAEPGASTQPGATSKPTTAPAVAARDGVIPLLAPATQPSSQPAVPSLAGQLESQYKHEFDVSAEKLSPGALLSFSARATDACYTGAQTGTSRTVTFRVVTPEELFREILLRQQAERSRFRKGISESEKLRADLVSLSSPEAASALARQHRLTQREVARIANALTESLTEMRLNVLGGPEAWDLMENGIIKPLRTLNDGLMSEQRDALDGLARSIDAKRQAEAGTRQDQIITKMNEILKQMSQWDSFVDVINQLNEIIKLQDNVKNNTEKLKEKQTEDVFK
jgi:hypothetical protein